MTDYAELSLLPEGLHDDLPPFARHEAWSIENLVSKFESYGYERVKPPLMEFEESLLSGPGASGARHMFRLMDPISQRMMGLRADMTTQVARIAATRLRQKPRPLRLCYAGQVLRVRGNQLRPERQYAQAGVELIGADGVTGDGEIVLLVAESLSALGVEGLSVALTIPTLVPLITQSFGLDEAIAETARLALDARDSAAIETLPDAVRDLLTKLSGAAGPAREALQRMKRINLPDEARQLCDQLDSLVGFLDGQNGDLNLTIDPGESRGFEYQTGVSFALFADGARGELGRGGRYSLEGGESAIGFTIYLDSLMGVVPETLSPRRLYLPFGTPADQARKLRDDGWTTIQGLEQSVKPEVEATSLTCSHILRGNRSEEL